MPTRPTPTKNKLIEICRCGGALSIAHISICKLDRKTFNWILQSSFAYAAYAPERNANIDDVISMKQDTIQCDTPLNKRGIERRKRTILPCAVHSIRLEIRRKMSKAYVRVQWIFIVLDILVGRAFSGNVCRNRKIQL